jgi:CRISPR/Cas system-associated protein Cas10 (large subunit of type III CRISPR-Cas system)
MLLESLYIFLNTFGKITNDIHSQLLKILQEVMGRSLVVSKEWENYLILQINKMINTKTMLEINKNKLTILIHICMQYTYKSEHNNFINSLMVIIPQLK